MIKGSNVGSGVANVYSRKTKTRDLLDDLAVYVQHDIKIYLADVMSTKSVFVANFRLTIGHDYLQRPPGQDLSKGFSDVPAMRRRRRNGPWPHPKMSEFDRRQGQSQQINCGIYQNYIGLQDRKR